MAYRSPEFIGMEDFYRFCACRVIEETGVPAAADKIVLHILAQHARAPFFVEVLECVKQFSKSCRLVLCKTQARSCWGKRCAACRLSKFFFQSSFAVIKAKPAAYSFTGCAVSSVYNRYSCCMSATARRMWTVRRRQAFAAVGSTVRAGVLQGPPRRIMRFGICEGWLTFYRPHYKCAHRVLFLSRGKIGLTSSAN